MTDQRTPSPHYALYIRLLVLAICLTGAPACTDRDPPPVSVQKSPYHDAILYSIASADCVITWTVYTTELNRGVVKHTSHCSLPLASQVPLLSSVTSAILTRGRNTQDLRTLFWGGLVPEQGGSALEMPSRLALAAHRSPDWDVRTGRPKSGDMNGAVRDLANDAVIYPELRALFNEFRLTAAVVNVEKVRVLKAKELPFYAELLAEGVQEWERLPFDAMVWFSLRPGNNPGRN